MKRMFMLVALVVLVARAALAETAINGIIIYYDPHKANIRVDLYNPDKEITRGPIQVTLFVRGKSDEEWRQIFEYPPIEKVLPGRHVAQDYFTPPGHADPAIASGTFHVRAVAVFPDGRRSTMEKAYP